MEHNKGDERDKKHIPWKYQSDEWKQETSDREHDIGSNIWAGDQQTRTQTINFLRLYLNFKWHTKKRAATQMRSSKSSSQQSYHHVIVWNNSTRRHTSDRRKAKTMEEQQARNDTPYRVRIRDTIYWKIPHTWKHTKEKMKRQCTNLFSLNRRIRETRITENIVMHEWKKDKKPAIWWPPSLCTAETPKPEILFATLSVRSERSSLEKSSSFGSPMPWKKSLSDSHMDSKFEVSASNTNIYHLHLSWQSP